MKISAELQSYLIQYFKDIVDNCCGEYKAKYECCGSSKKWKFYITDGLNITSEITFKLKNKQLTALDYFLKKTKKQCCLDNKELVFKCCNNKIKIKII